MSFISQMLSSQLSASTGLNVIVDIQWQEGNLQQHIMFLNKSSLRCCQSDAQQQAQRQRMTEHCCECPGTEMQPTVAA